jgi:hypothetical protein
VLELFLVEVAHLHLLAEGVLEIAHDNLRCFLEDDKTVASFHSKSEVAVRSVIHKFDDQLHDGENSLIDCFESGHYLRQELEAVGPEPVEIDLEVLSRSHALSYSEQHVDVP